MDTSAIIQTKNFYRNNFRRGLGVLVFMLMVMVVLVLALLYEIVTKPEPDFFATNSAGLIADLSPLDAPNLSSTHLLKPDPPKSESKVKMKV